MAATLEVRCAHFAERDERPFAAMIENHEHHDLRGPAAGEAQTRLENLQRTAYTGSVVTDRLDRPAMISDATTSVDIPGS